MKMVTGTRSLALVLFICLYNPWTKHGVEAIILEDQDVTELFSPYPDKTNIIHHTRVDPYSCHFNPCLNGGTCHYHPGLTRTKRLIPPGFEDFGFCECPPSHFGFHCEHKDPCTPNPCQNGGSCSSKGHEFNCRCRAQYIGRHCEILNDPCAQKPCQNGGTCYSLGNKMHFCFCKPQFTGSSCEKVNCNTRPCRNGGTCLNVENRSFCKCPAGVTGKFCEGEIPVVTKDPQDSIHMEGDDVTLCCQATGSPAPVYEWFHNGAPLLQQLRNYRNLHLSRLSSRDSGSYQCRARNKFGATVSNEATLTVVPGNRDDSCNPIPLTKVVSLPEGCKEDSSGSNNVNVGTCSNEECVKRNQRHAGSCGEKNPTRQCCSPASMSDSRVTCKSGMKFNIQKVSKCACAACAVSKIVVRGKVVDPEGNPLWRGEMTVGNDAGNRYYTDRRGNFKILVKSGTKRIVLTIKDKLQRLLVDTTKVFELHEGQVSFYTIVLQKKPPAIKFPGYKKKSISLGGSGGRPNFVDLDIPANAFLTADGRVYTGEITATIGVTDPRSQADMTAAPGDFSAIDDNGEEVTLGSVGMLRQVFTDSNGNQLSLAKNISVRIDADLLDIPNGVTVYQWYLSKKTGRWVKFGVLRSEQGGSSRLKRQQTRRFFVSEITPSIPLEYINWDYVTAPSHVRITAPSGTVVTRIGLSDNGKQYTSYRQDTVPAGGTLCVLSFRDKQAILQAERDGVPLIPRKPTGFPLLVNPEIIDRSSVGNGFKIQSLRFTSTKADDRGPIYLKGEHDRCSQRGVNDFAFEFQDANVGQLFNWKSIRIDDPSDPRLWQVRTDEICFVKALVVGTKPDSVIYVRSIGKARGKSDVEYGYTAEKSATVGRQGVVCLEYRCNEGSSGQYQTHLQFLTLTGSCTVQRLNNVLNSAQNRCTVPPSSSSSQERNFCVPRLVGDDAGLYSGDTGVAKYRCLTGNQQYNSGRPITTNLNPTITIRCR